MMNTRLSLVAIITVLLCAVSVAVAQDIDGFDPAAIEAKADELRKDAQALFDHATASAEARREEAQVVVDEGFQAIEGLDVSGVAGEAGPFDFDEMVAGAKASLAAPRSAPLFIAFASLSMPEEALARMIEDTTRAGGVIVFRGFTADDPQAFTAGIRAVVDQAEASNVAIDPRLFRSFAIDRVPTYVAVSSDFEPCDQLDCVTPPPPHDRIAGNVSVAYVLETFADANGPGAPVARHALANLRGER